MNNKLNKPIDPATAGWIITVLVGIFLMCAANMLHDEWKDNVHYNQKKDSMWDHPSESYQGDVQRAMSDEAHRGHEKPYWAR